MMYSKYLFLRDLVSNRLRGRPTPLYLYWFVTENCNLRCIYCYGNFCKKPHKDLSTEETLRLVDEFARGGVRRITILGGEPLLYKDIDLVVAALGERNISCSILTNGTLVVDRLDVLKKVDEVGLSIDGRPELHDSIRGEGNFNDNLKAIEALKSIGKTVVFTFTIFSENIGELDYVLDFVKEHDVYLTVNLAHGRINEEKKFPVSKADNERLREALRKIIEHKRKGYPIFRTYRTLHQMLSWKDYQIDGSKEKPTAGFPVCLFGKYAACVNADGVILPCFLGCDSTVGRNILEVGFEQAWKNCQGVEHCLYCHVPCFIEYNALLNLKPYMLMSIVSKLLLKKLN